MALELSLDYRLRWMDFDRYGRLQPWAVLDLCQDVATEHAEQIGIGRDAMERQGVFWAVIRTKVEMAGAAAHHQKVVVRTWPHTLSRFSFIRDFTVRDESGGLLAKATSEWVLMSTDERKFVSVRDYYDGPTDFCEERCFPKKPRKIPAFQEGNRPMRTVVPAYCDIDVNGHVNNAMYAKFVVDALDPGSAGAVKGFQIDYRQEALAGQSLAVHTLVEDGRVLSKGVREDGEVSFAALIEL